MSIEITLFMRQKKTIQTCYRWPLVASHTHKCESSHLLRSIILFVDNRRSNFCLRLIHSIYSFNTYIIHAYTNNGNNFLFVQIIWQIITYCYIYTRRRLCIHASIVRRTEKNDANSLYRRSFWSNVFPIPVMTIEYLHICFSSRSLLPSGNQKNQMNERILSK